MKKYLMDPEGRTINFSYINDLMDEVYEVLKNDVTDISYDYDIGRNPDGSPDYYTSYIYLDVTYLNGSKFNMSFGLSELNLNWNGMKEDIDYIVNLVFEEIQAKYF